MLLVFEEVQKNPLPTIVVFEDVHWADEATLDLITFLGRRIPYLSVLFLLTSRDSELSLDHPLRSVVGSLPAHTLTRLPLSPLSEQAVTRLAQQAGRSVEGLYAVTGGNPFFVSQVLSSDTPGVPLQVRDAVLARLNRLSPAAQRLLELLSVVPTRTERWLLEAVLSEPEEELNECITAGMLSLDHTTVAFRHELARLAVESTLSPLCKQTLHAQALHALLSGEVEVSSAARLVHHARGAQDGKLVLRYAPLAARQAAERWAHRQAAEHYRSALSSRELLEAPGQEELHAALLDSLAQECWLTGQTQEAFEALEAALPLWRRLGRTVQVAHTLIRLAGHCRLLGRSGDSSLYAVEVVELLSTLSESRELGPVYARLSQLFMVTNYPKQALIWGRRALEVARAFDDRETECYSLFSTGFSLFSSGEQEGRAVLEQSLQLAQEQGFEEIASFVYGNLTAVQVSRRAYAQATGYLQEGLAYCEEHDLDACGTALRANRAWARLGQGDWVGAEEDAAAILSTPRITVTNRIVALLTRSLLLMRRGEEGVLPLLDEAHALAAASGGGCKGGRKNAWLKLQRG